MGSKKRNCPFGYVDDFGNFVEIGEIPYEIPEATFPVDTHVELINASLTFRCRVRQPRTRKRFVKYLMGRKGYSRNEANALAESYHRHGYTWEQAFLDLALWSA